jgi:hypothetical protein
MVDFFHSGEEEGERGKRKGEGRGTLGFTGSALRE